MNKRIQSAWMRTHWTALHCRRRNTNKKNRTFFEKTLAIYVKCTFAQTANALVKWIMIEAVAGCDGTLECAFKKNVRFNSRQTIVNEVAHILWLYFHSIYAPLSLYSKYFIQIGNRMRNYAYRHQITRSPRTNIKTKCKYCTSRASTSELFHFNCAILCWCT